MRTLLYESEISDAWTQQLKTAIEFRIAMALVTKSGTQMMVPHLKEVLEKGGKGQFLIGIDMPTDPDAINALVDLQNEFQDRFEIAYFQPEKRRMFHAKLALFSNGRGKWSAILGSSNFTAGGFEENYEANILIDESKIAGQYLAFFDELFQGGFAQAVTEDWLDAYQSRWAERQKLKSLLAAARERVRVIPPPALPRPLPPRIKGYRFAFTGRITDWPRDAKLYPAITTLDGIIVKSPNGVPTAHCLVHGDILGGKKSTLKLMEARNHTIPRIDPDRFFQILAEERRLRRKESLKGVKAQNFSAAPRMRR